MREKEIKSLEKQKDTDERGVRRCETCQKRSLSGRCRVLVKNIGRDQDCWAWTDDPDWEQKVRQAVKEYVRMGGGITDDDWLQSNIFAAILVPSKQMLDK